MGDKIDVVIQKNISGDQQSGNSMAVQQQQRHSEGSSKRPEWLTSIVMNKSTETDLKSNQLQWQQIPRVPRMFREIGENKACYDPLRVSIGPYHHGNTKFEEMQKLKITMAKEFVADCNKNRIETLYDCVAKVAKNARKYYSEELMKQFDENKFTEMMFLDGCFILQFIICFLRKPGNLKMTRHDAALVKSDLFLLENQLPFPVLKELIRYKFPNETEGKELINEFIANIRALPPQPDTCKKRIEKFVHTYKGAFKDFVNYIWLRTQKNDKRTSGDAYATAAHLLELLRIQFIEETYQTSSDHSQIENVWYRYHPATDLKRVGIHFEPSRTNRYWDNMNFKPTFFGGVLKLPPITIDESTKSMFLNLVAYESGCAASNLHGVASYVCFMDSLIDRAEDVRELRSKGIIHSFLGSDEEVAKLFNEIANNLVPNPQAYAKVKKDIESHYKNFFKLWMIRHQHDISIASAKYATLFGVIFAALKIVFPLQSTCIENFKLTSTNFTRGP